MIVKLNEEILTQGVYRVRSVILLSRARKLVWGGHVASLEAKKGIEKASPRQRGK